MPSILLLALVAYMVVRRIKRSIGFQEYNPTTLIVRMVIFAIFALSILSVSIIYPSVLFYNGLGIIAGLVLAYIATNHAEFEKREGKLYFKTHIWVEVIVIALFLIRLVYRIILKYGMHNPQQSEEDIQASMQYMHDPLTSIIVIAFCTYYIAYFSFI